ncbi:cation:proton antiporter [Chloroflexi bacterium TSY]|nr:cation:proton antiporter [Chloroflexi bacterium TSY]
MELIWLTTAYGAGLGAKALRLPVLVGFLLAGLILAASGVTATDTLITIGDFGVTVLLFAVGLHIRIKNMLRLEVLGVGSIHMLISGALFTSVLFILGVAPIAALLVAIGLGFSSTVLTAKSLEARKELDAYHGRVAIGILILQDLVAVVLLAFTGAEMPNWWAVGLLILPFLRPLLLRGLEFSGQDELLLVYGLLMALGVGWLFEIGGLSAKLGALVAGVLLSGHERANELYDKLWAIKEVFLVAFFLQVGLTGLPSLGDLWMLGFLLLLLPLKGILFFVLLLVFRLRARTAFMTSLTLTAYSEFALIVGAASAQSGLMPESIVVILGLLVAVSYALNAPLSNAANSLWRHNEGWLCRFERQRIDHPDEQPHALGRTDILIVGMGRVGTAAYDYLIENGNRPLGLDNDPAQIERNLAAGRRVIFGDEQDPELWQELEIKGLYAVLLATPDHRGSALATQLLRELGFDGPINAVIRNEADSQPLIDAGVTTISLPMTQAGTELAKASLPIEGTSG